MSQSTIKAKKIEAKRQMTKKTTSVWIWVTVGVITFTALFWVISQTSQMEKSGLKAEITVEEAAKLKDEGAFVLDVREPSEWTQFHIAGAKLIPLGSLASEVDSLPKDKTIVVVCRTGRRSAEGRDILKKAGFENVTSMAGGIVEWQAKGLPITTGE